MPDLTPTERRSQTLASSCRTIAGLLRDGDPVSLVLAEHAYTVASGLIRDLDPRTPPADVARALVLVGSDALAVLVGLYGGDASAIANDAVVALNLTGLVGYHLLGICGELPAVLAYGTGGGAS
jgi:hypothetical protein